jgi:uncharacterized GH25 family protein
VLAVLAVSAVAVVAWLALRSDVTTDNSQAAATPSSTAQASTAVEVPPQPVEAPREEQPTPPSDPTSELASQRAEVSAAAEGELAEALWVEGVVQLPAGVPLDEELEVVADGKKFQHLETPGGMHRAKVGADGRFRVAFSKSTKNGTLRLDARYCYLDEAYKLKLAKLPASIVLEARLGGRIVGQLMPPPGASDVAAVLEKASFHATSQSSTGMPHAVKAEIDERSRYELCGLVSELEHQVSFRSDTWAPFTARKLTVKPGETRQLDITLVLGAIVSGRVLDEQGAPVRGARVEFRSLQLDETSWFHNRYGTSDAQGAYRVTGILPGEWKVAIECAGYRSLEREFGALKDAERREGVEFTLSSGNFVSGVVRWESGEPAERATVLVALAAGAPTSDEQLDDKPKRVDADGRFRISGLPAGPYDVTASAPEGSRPQPAGAEKRSKLGGPKWIAEAKSVNAGSELELVLRPGLALRGRVVDERDQPVTRFTVRADSRRDNGMVWRSDWELTQKFESEDGSFALEGVREGDWVLTVNAKGFATPDEQRVKAPQSDAEALVVRLSRFARVRGVVVDSAGKPVAGATLEVQSESSGQRVVFQRGEQDATDDEGRFELDDVTPGASKLTAKHAQHAPSLPFELRLTPGEELADVRLVLPIGGSVVGRIHQSHLAPDVVWAVSLHASGRMSQNLETQADGSFVVERLTPGGYTLTAYTRPKTPRNASVEEQTRDTRHLRGSVEVRAGETSEVTLGAPSGAPIPLSGRVTLGGRPVVGASIYASRSEFTSQAVSDANGNYKCDLDGPGKYLLYASLQSGVSLNVRIEVTSDAALTQNFAFEGTLLAGVVQFEDGKPVANAYVTVELERAAIEGQGGAARAGAQLKDDGRFEFEGLAPGVYSLSVRDLTGLSTVARFGTTHVGDIALQAGARRDDLVIRVAPDAVLECRVSSSSGAPAPGARLKLFDPSGGNYGSWSQETTDGVGIARVGGLAAGEVRVMARSAGEAGLSAATTVRAGATVQAAVQLRLSGSIAITRVDEQGKPAGGSMAIIDESGFDWGRGASEWKVEGDVWTASPLPAGRYRVSGSNKTSASGESVVSVAAGETASVTLEFKAR